MHRFCLCRNKNTDNAGKTHNDFSVFCVRQGEIDTSERGFLAASCHHACATLLIPDGTDGEAGAAALVALERTILLGPEAEAIDAGRILFIDR